MAAVASPAPRHRRCQGTDAGVSGIRRTPHASNKDAPPRGPGGAQVFQSPSLVVNEGETQRVRSIRTRGTLKWG